MVSGETKIMHPNNEISNIDLVKMFIKKNPYFIGGSVLLLLVITVSAATGHLTVAPTNGIINKEIIYVDPGESLNKITFYPNPNSDSDNDGIIEGTFMLNQQSGNTIGGTYKETPREYQLRATKTGEGRNLYKTKDGGINFPIRNTKNVETWYPKNN
jgi:hypothetical protein